MSNTAPEPAKITEDDLRAKIQSLQDGIQGQVADKRNTLITVGGTALVVLLVLFFLMGKRSGKKKTTLVEIRRV
jgi:predicted PurR-regulated permease PerM